MTEQRPWGSYTVIQNSDSHKLKSITVKPGMRLSYQSHAMRKEVWTIVKGYAKFTLDGVESLLTVGDVAIIPIGAKHRVENASTEHELEFIEVQVGSYFGEDDIVRYSDDYGRV